MYAKDCVEAGIATKFFEKWYNNNAQGTFALITEYMDEDRLRGEGINGNYKNILSGSMGVSLQSFTITGDAL